MANAPTVRPSSEVAVLLGAGASKDAGCPLVEELTASFGDTIRDDRRLQPAYDWLVETLDKLPQVRAGELKIDVELVLAALRELQARHTSVLTPFVSSWSADVRRFGSRFAELEERLKEHIRAKCEVRRGDVMYLTPLLDLARGKALDVFTLNYDYTIELLCQERNRVCHDGFVTYWQPESFEAIDADVRLFKLHGSLLWYQTSRPPRRLVKIPVSGSNAERSLRFYSDDAVSNSVIYPALAKEQHAEPYATLLSYFRSALKTAQFLVVIGLIP